MKFGLLIFFALLLSTLSAQEEKGVNGYEEWSLTFSPRWGKKIEVNSFGFLEENFTSNPDSRLNLIDTFQIDGETRIYFTDIFAANDKRGAPRTSNTWFGLNFTYHRRTLKGRDLSAGLYYSQGTSGVVISDFEEGLPQDFLYRNNEEQTFSGGFNLRLNQHVWRNKKVHPYFGVAVYLLVDHIITNGEIFSVFPQYDLVLLTNTLPDNFRRNTIFNFDLSFSMGLLYQLSSSWAIGIEANSRTEGFAGLLGLQVRRRI